MNIHCYCGRGYDLHYKLKKQLLSSFDAFCGEECLYELLVEEGFKDRSRMYTHPLIYPSHMDAPFDFWCKETKQFFRSRSEATFARWCDANEIDWRYETYTIRFKSNYTYTPDFWLPEYSHFVEIKGVWSGSAKRKLRSTKEAGFHIVLVADHLIRKLTRLKIKNE
jgi:hypothetical protein